MRGLISRTIRYRQTTFLLNLYKYLVRPHLDYCLSVWSPYYIKDRAARASPTLLHSIVFRTSKLAIVYNYSYCAYNLFIRAGNRGRWPASVKLITLPYLTLPYDHRPRRGLVSSGKVQQN